MIQRTNGTGLTIHRGKYVITYYEDGKRSQKVTGTTNRRLAEKLRDEFLKDAPIRSSPKYLYKQGRKWLVRIKGKEIGRYSTEKEARMVRDHYLKNLS